MKHLDDLRKLTNFDEVVRRVEPHVDPPQPAVEPVSPQMPQMPVTTDPLQANFGSVHMAQGLSSASVKPSTRVLGWILLAIPALVMWLGMLNILRENWHDDLTPWQILGRVLAFAVITAASAFWPYLLLRRRR